jgi:hypothetical protein
MRTNVRPEASYLATRFTRVLYCNYNNVSSDVHVLHLRLAGLHLGPCSVLPGTRLVRELPVSHRVLQYGYHISALNQIQATLTCRAAPPLHSHRLPTCIPMSDAVFSLVTSIFTVGGFLGSSIAGMVMERHGRKAALQFSGLFVAVGSGLMAIAPSTTLLLLGRHLARSIVITSSHLLACRFLTGCGAGIGLCSGPVFLAEIAPSNIRGSVGTGFASPLIFPSSFPKQVSSPSLPSC